MTRLLAYAAVLLLALAAGLVLGDVLYFWLCVLVGALALAAR